MKYCNCGYAETDCSKGCEVGRKQGVERTIVADEVTCPACLWRGLVTSVDWRLVKQIAVKCKACGALFTCKKTIKIESTEVQND